MAGDYVPNVFIGTGAPRDGRRRVPDARVGSWAIRRTVRMGKRSLLMMGLPFAIALPYLANSTLIHRDGPAAVDRLRPAAHELKASTSVSGGWCFTLLGFTLIYAILIMACVYLMVKYARADTERSQTTACPR